MAHASSEMKIQAWQLSISKCSCGLTVCGVINKEDQFVDVGPGSAHQYIAAGQGSFEGHAKVSNLLPAVVSSLVMVSQISHKSEISSQLLCSTTSTTPILAINGIFQAYGKGI
jgi:hypothetical protein